MKLGFNTSCLFELSFSEVVNYADENGFQALEISCTPENSMGVHHLDVEDITIEKAESINDYLKEKKLEISCLGYYANPLANETEKTLFNEYFRKVIEAAEMLGVKNVSTFTGFSPGKSIRENLELFAETFKPILAFAGERGIRILLENTPLVGTSTSGGNLAYSPEMWDVIFTSLPEKNLGLNYDPSHLFWLGIDYMLFINVFKERIFHVQAKDAEILIERLRITGIIGADWFRYRLPGQGSIEWKKLIPAFYESGFNGVISIEHEDPVWYDTLEKRQRGLMLAKKTLDELVV